MVNPQWHCSKSLLFLALCSSSKQLTQELNHTLWATVKTHCNFFWFLIFFPLLWLKICKKVNPELCRYERMREGNTKADLHFCDWHILKEQALCKLFLRGFDSEKDDSTSLQQRLSQGLYRTQHCKLSKTNSLSWSLLWERWGERGDGNVERKQNLRK